MDNKRMQKKWLKKAVDTIDSIQEEIKTRLKNKQLYYVRIETKEGELIEPFLTDAPKTDIKRGLSIMNDPQYTEEDLSEAFYNNGYVMYWQNNLDDMFGQHFNDELDGFIIPIR